MASGTSFKGSNLVMKGNGNEVGDLPVLAHKLRGGGHSFTSCWELSREELGEVLRTGRLYVTFLAPAHPALHLGTESETRALLCDIGGPMLPRQEA